MIHVTSTLFFLKMLFLWKVLWKLVSCLLPLHNCFSYLILFLFSRCRIIISLCIWILSFCLMQYFPCNCLTAALCCLFHCWMAIISIKCSHVVQFILHIKIKMCPLITDDDVWTFFCSANSQFSFTCFHVCVGFVLQHYSRCTIHPPGLFVCSSSQPEPTQMYYQNFTVWNIKVFYGATNLL